MTRRGGKETSVRFRKGKSAVEGDPKKSWSGLKRRWELSKGRLAQRLAYWGFTEKEDSHLLGLRGRHQYSDQRSNRNRAPCVASTTVGTEEEEDQMARLSV